MKVLTVIMITEMVKPVVKVIIRMSVKRMVRLKVGLTFYRRIDNYALNTIKLSSIQTLTFDFQLTYLGRPYYVGQKVLQHLRKINFFASVAELLGEPSRSRTCNFSCSTTFT